MFSLVLSHVRQSAGLTHMRGGKARASEDYLEIKARKLLIPTLNQDCTSLFLFLKIATLFLCQKIL